MRHAVIEMNPDRDVTLEVCAYDLPSESEPTTTLEHPRPAVIICPGGGYEYLSVREADAVAIAFQRHGFNTFILRYSVREHSTFPHPAIDAARAVRWVRKHAVEWGIDPQRVTVLGFSAGGHVTALIGTHHDDPALADAERAEYEALTARGVVANDGLMEHSSRPDAIVLSYAVYVCDWADERQWRDIMATDCIAKAGPHVPPAFVWTTGEDAIVPPTQSLRFVNALSEAGVPFEYHHFARGRHGLSTADTITNFDVATPENAHTWVDMCARWLRVTLG